MSEDNKKSKKARSGFLAVKLTDDALNYQLENYDKLSGLSSMRGKATLAFLILYIFGWMTFVGQNPSLSHGIGYSLLIIGIIMAVIIYKWTKVGIIIAFMILLLNALITLMDDPTKILGALIAFYILTYFLYPAYQVEKNRKHKMP
jgi:hypothetical protein